MKMHNSIYWVIGVLFLSAPTISQSWDVFKDDSVIWQGGTNTFVKLAPQDSQVLGANDHPVDLGADDVLTIISRLEFEGKESPVFTGEQAKVLANALVTGLNKAATSQDIVFAFERTKSRSMLGLKPEIYFMAGRAFYRQNQLHIMIGDYDRWRNTSAEKAYDPTEIGSYKYTFDHGKRASMSPTKKARLVSMDGLKNMRYKGAVRTDWIVIDIDRALLALQQADDMQYRLSLVKKRKEILDALGEDAALIIPQATPAPVPVQQPRSIEDRLMTLKGLKDKGLITDEEFAAKRQQILDSL